MPNHADVVLLDRRTLRVNLAACTPLSSHPRGARESIARDLVVFGQRVVDDKGNVLSPSLCDWLLEHYIPVNDCPPKPALNFIPSLVAIWETTDGRVFAEL